MVAVLVAFLVLAPTAPAIAAPTCQDVAEVGSFCLTVEDGRAIVTGPLGINLSVDVPVPVPTEVIVPGPTRTVTLPPPAPATVTRTQTATVTAAPTTVTERATETTRTTVTRTATPTLTSTPMPPVGQERDRPDTMIQQVVRNVGIPLLWIVIGVILALVVQYIMYALGRSDAKHTDEKWLESLLNRKRR